ncbi:hypothetical protein HF888_11125 [Bermanella marisrubri]|uniref:Uncharacterized protein n=1 Tax=Bermanella marisrubri TaxID=207949 RepID=Q1MXM6_9GAMM|nr:hypothetical protein [Bermanella marisrubri]EAT10729.1 hypothetical protein RED65_07454 [Oceanobacter sp. RED65] [Bermanella marisrubri]QIZ84735.1 hypothetical protein HF888_11125 [Bermanella marisrubri]
MRYIIALSTIIIIATTSTIIYAFLDDDLSQESQSLIRDFEAQHNQSDSEAYWLLMGFDAPKGTDPIMHAKQNRQERAKDYPHLFSCSLHKADCVDKVVESFQSKRHLVKEYGYLYSRYQKLMGLSDYQTLEKPNIEYATPHLFTVLFAHNLFISEQLSNKNTEHAVNELKTNIQAIANHLNNQDTVLGTLVFQELLNRSLNAFAYLKYKHGYELLDLEIRDIRNSLKQGFLWEFMIAVDLFKGLDGNPAFFSPQDIVPSWYVNLLFKPNMTINQEARETQYLIDLLYAPDSQFLSRYLNESIPKVGTDQFRNYGGSILLEMKGVDEKENILQTRLLNSKVLLINNGKRAVHPFSSEIQTIQKDGSLCFDSEVLMSLERFNCIPFIDRLVR